LIGSLRPTNILLGDLSTLRIMPFTMLTLSIKGLYMTLSIKGLNMTLSKITFTISTLSIKGLYMTLSIKGLYMTLSICDTQYK
jgi:hypothetical protein